MKNSELCVPAGALASDAEDGAAVGPEVGDTVEVLVSGRVTRAEGGNIYLMPESANGQPLPESGGEKSLEEEGEELAGELNHGGAYPGGSMALLVAFVLGLLGMAAAMPYRAGAADVEFARERVCTQTIVSNYVANTTPRQLFNVEIDNYTGGTLYLMVFDSATNQLAGSTAFAATPVPIPTGAVGGKDWGPQGIPFERGVNVALSTTPRSLTNSSSGGIVTVVSSPRK